MLWLRIISFSDGIIVLGTVLIIFLGQFLLLSVNYVDKTKVIVYRKYFFGFVILVFAATSLAPTIFYSDQEMRKAISTDDIFALQWLGKNSTSSDVVLGTLSEGHLISAIAKSVLRNISPSLVWWKN